MSAATFTSNRISWLEAIAAGYFPNLLEMPYVVPPTLGQQAGIVGALLL